MPRTRVDDLAKLVFDDPNKPLYVVRRWQDTSTYKGRVLDRGEILHLEGARNDQLMIRFGYFAPYEGTQRETARCSECGKTFSQDSFRKLHGDRRHRPEQDLDPFEQEQAIDQEKSRLDREVPFLNVGEQTPVQI